MDWLHSRTTFILNDDCVSTHLTAHAEKSKSAAGVFILKRVETLRAAVKEWTRLPGSCCSFSSPTAAVMESFRSRMAAVMLLSQRCAE